MAKEAKKCIFEEKECNDCGDCKCDLNPQKVCDNCEKCLNETDAEYLEILIDDIMKGDENVSN